MGVLGWPLAYGALRMARELQLEVPPRRLAVAAGIAFGLLMSLLPAGYVAMEVIRDYPP